MPYPTDDQRDRPWVIRTYAGHSSAATSNELSNVYEDLASQLSSQLQISNSAQLFVFLAIALAMAAAVLLLVLTMSKRS